MTSARTAVLNQVRANGREVAWLPEFMGLGNLLYMWHWAYSGQRDGVSRRCLANDNTRRWLPVFPEARPLVALRDEVRFTDNRVQPWRTAPDLSRRYDPPHLEEFCRDIVLPGLTREAPASAPPDRLVINVRRGDYYTPEHVGQFGFDVAAFVHAALEHSVSEAGVPSSVHFVSDDTDWCAEHLDFVGQVAPVTYAGEPDPLRDLREVAHARRVILANSTFSYWAGYLGDALPGDRQVIAPAFWGRSELGSTRHLRPHWTAVDVGA